MPPLKESEALEWAEVLDATRAGFVMGEGACALLLEEMDRARARGAEIYAEVLGYGASNDAHHLAQPEPEATGVAHMMRSALARAGVDPERVVGSGPGASVARSTFSAPPSFGTRRFANPRISGVER